MKNTGQMLKSAREEKGLSLHEIALALKLSTKVLKAIEENDAQNLPAKTFLRGFVQSYAQYLKLDLDKVMTSFSEEMGSTRPAPILKNDDTSADLEIPVGFSDKPAGRSEVTQLETDSRFQIKPIIYGIAVVILLAMIGLVKKMVDKYQKEAKIPVVETTAEPIKNSESTESAAATVSTNTNEKSEPEAKTLPAETKPPVDMAPENIKKNIPLPIPTAVDLKAKEPLSKSTSAPESKPTESIAEAKVSAEKKAEAPLKPTLDLGTVKLDVTKPVEDSKPITDNKTKPIELIVESMDLVEIEYSASNGKSGKIKLNADQVHTFRSSHGLKLSISNGGAVNLVLNGKDLGVPGELGKPIKLNY